MRLLGYAKSWEWLSLVVVGLMVGCSHLPNPDERLKQANYLAEERGWVSQLISAPPFTLRAFLPKKIVPSETLSLYIEGDGLAWVFSDMPSSDPSPVQPTGLRLALAQAEGVAAYLARPCQYRSKSDTSEHCSSRYWTGERYSSLVIDSMNRAVDSLKRRVGAKRLILIGYSGGGAVATLIAARRDDIGQLVTVAGNLDIAAWASYQKVTPLDGSMNPADVASSLGRLPQTHYAGSRDTIIPSWLVQHFTALVPGLPRPRVIVIPNFDHVCCWVSEWDSLYKAASRPN
jgi:pimeloyl-ACP methyl ester carboxylesterase